MKNHLMLISALLLLIMSGCGITYYPNKVNTPFFKGKGETQLSVGTGFNGFDFQSAYAVSDKFGLMLNANTGQKHSLLEAGLGYLNNLGDNGRVEFFAGGGTGGITIENPDIFVISEPVSGRYTRLFIQPAIGATSKYVDGGLALRVVHLNYNDDITSQTKDQLAGSASYFEPVITGRFGAESIKFYMQAGLSLSLGGDIANNQQQPFIFNFGVHINISKAALMTKPANEKNSKSKWE